MIGKELPQPDETWVKMEIQGKDDEREFERGLDPGREGHEKVRLARIREAITDPQFCSRRQKLRKKMKAERRA